MKDGRRRKSRGKRTHIKRRTPHPSAGRKHALQRGRKRATGVWAKLAMADCCFLFALPMPEILHRRVEEPTAVEDVVKLIQKKAWIFAERDHKRKS